MKGTKSKIIYTVLMALAMLFALSVKSWAVTMTPSDVTAESGKEFEIEFKFSDKISGFNAYMTYNDDLISSLSSGTDELTVVEYEGEGTATAIYVHMSTEPTIDTLKIKAKASEVTEEKVAEIKLSSLQLTAKDVPSQNLDNDTVKVTIKPASKKELTVNKTSVTLKVGGTETITATGEGTITYKSSNEKVATVDKNGKITAIGVGTANITITDEAENTKTVKVTIEEVKNESVSGTENSTTDNKDASVSKTVLSKTGEKEFVLIAMGVLVIFSIIAGIKVGKVKKMFVILPILVATAAVGNSSKAAEKPELIDCNKATIGYLAEHSDISGVTGLENTFVLGISPNNGFLSVDADGANTTRIYLSEIIDESDIENMKLVSSSKSTKKITDPIATGDKIEVYNNNEVVETIYPVIFGDSNGDGQICSIGDIEVIKYDWLYGHSKRPDTTKVAKGVYRMASNIFFDESVNEATSQTEGLLNVFDINRMVLKFTSNKSGNKIIGDTLINKMDVFASDDEALMIIADDEKPSVAVGQTYKLGANKTVTWGIDTGYRNYMSVDEDGTIHGLAVGKAKVYAISTGDSPERAEIEIEVVE